MTRRACVAAAIVAIVLAAVPASAGAPLTYEAYADGFARALVTGAPLDEVGRYTPPADARPRHTVRIFQRRDDHSYWYVTDGLGFVRQPGAEAGSRSVFVELATYADRKDLRIAEVLSLMGEAMIEHPARGAWDAWRYDTISPPAPIYGLRSFVLRPGGELRIPRSDAKEQMVSIFTVIPLADDERPQVVNAGREKARAWVESHAAASPAAMRARWKLR